MTGIRTQHGKEFELKVVVAALSGEKNLSQLASEYGVHTTQIKEWRAQALEAIGERLAQRRGKQKQESPESRLYEEIGRLKVELDFLSGKLGR